MNLDCLEKNGTPAERETVVLDHGGPHRIMKLIDNKRHFAAVQFQNFEMKSEI